MGLAISKLAARHADEAQAEDVGEVVVEHVACEAAPGEHGVEDPAHPRLAQPRDQRVDVRAPLEDDRLLGGLDVRGGDGDVRSGHVLVDDLIGERVDEPRVALRELVDAGRRLGLEALAGRGGVLGEELLDLGLGERARASSPRR